MSEVWGTFVLSGRKSLGKLHPCNKTLNSRNLGLAKDSFKDSFGQGPYVKDSFKDSFGQGPYVKDSFKDSLI